MKLVNKLDDIDGDQRTFIKLPIKIKAVELKRRVRIKTREGELFGEKGDFLIEGIKGEVYPCGREIFHKTYREVKKNG